MTSRSCMALVLALLCFLSAGCQQPSGQESPSQGGDVEAPMFSHSSGLYDSSIDVVLTCATAEAQIRYTTDGTDPTETNGVLYTGPVSVPYTLNMKAFAYRDGWTSSGVSSAVYRIRSSQLDLIIRDFTPSTNLDFEYSSIGSDLDIVNALLGSDRLPVYAGTGATSTVHSPTSFWQWFHDESGVNIRLSDIMLLTQSAGAWSCGNVDFFPIDGLGFGNTPGYDHNYHFTTEIHGSFYYEGGESFDITANDDTWLFINGRLVVDMGGIHATTYGTALLDGALAETCSLVSSNIYHFDLFHAQRHTVTSDFLFSTTATLLRTND